MRDKRRWIEWGKNLLIVLLTLSAGWLLTMTPLVQDSGVMGTLSSQGGSGAGLPVESRGAAILPVRLAFAGTGGRFGVQYNEARLEELFPPLGALLGDALASAGQPRPISEREWRKYLGGTSAYFDFQGEAPLAALERWLGGPGETALAGCARRVMLCAGEGDQVLLCWQEAGSGQFFSCPTALTRGLHLEPAVESQAPNGAYFAFESQKLTRLLDPYTLITEGEQGGAGYTVSVPLSAGGAETAAVLEALSFNGQNHAQVSGGEVYLDGGDRLVVDRGGTVTYRAAQSGKYPVGEGAANGADGARALAERTLGALCGEARLYLMSAQEEDGVLRVRFGYLLDGCAVRLDGEGWAAELWVRDGYIVQFTLRFRSYAANGTRALLLPIDKAAAMLPDLTQERRELVLQYWDTGGSLSLEWVAA